MEKKKIIVPSNFIKESELPKNIKNFFDGIREIGEATKKEEEQYLIDLNKKIELIVESNDSYSNMLRDLIELKASIEKEKIETKYGSRKKTIEEKAIPLLQVQITKLNELIRNNVDLKTNEKNVVVAKTNESEINSASIQINSAEPELTLHSAKKPKVYFNKIKPTYSVEDIAKLFSKLYLTINEANQKPFLSKEDVEHLLAQTIEGYSSEQVEHRMLKANFNSKQQGLFYAFIYSFYTANQQGSADEKTIYAKFIQANFKGFGNKPVDQIYKRLRAAIGSQKTHPLIK
jgi:hypothetical protein